MPPPPNRIDHRTRLAYSIPGWRSLGQADDQPHEQGSCHRRGQGRARVAVAGVGFGEDVGRGQIEEEAGEQAQVGRDQGRRDRDQCGQCRAQDRGEGVEESRVSALRRALPYRDASV